MPATVHRSVRGRLPKPLAEGVRDFAKQHPECLEPTYITLYLIVLTTAELIDQKPNAALLREFSLANTKLRKEILGVDEGGQSLAELMSDGD